MPENEEIVTVPVPARLLPVVYRALSEAMRDENTRATQNGQALPAVQRNGALDFTDVSNCRRLRAGLTSPGLVNNGNRSRTSRTRWGEPGINCKVIPDR
jgi:hypothetical protein